MDRTIPSTRQEVADQINGYLGASPNTARRRALARRADVTDDALRKYAAGINMPPPDKLSRIVVAMTSPNPSSPTTEAPTNTIVDLFEEHQTRPIILQSVIADQDDARADVAGLLSYRLGPREYEDLPTATLHKPDEQQEFYLPVHGFVWFYRDEVNIIDHPAFQRLAGLHQLGLAHLTYRGPHPSKAGAFTRHALDGTTDTGCHKVELYKAAEG